MSDPKRANLITVGAPKCAKKIVSKTVRLTINLVESNESKYPELNYKELVIAEERKQHVENGKTGGLDPFSDNDEDVERVAKKFEQKYGNNSPYRKKKRRSKNDDFADIGAGYDENDSFIDNTHGYDEMIPPNIDTLHGGFYINCGSLEFKTVPNDESGIGDEPRRNKRRISSSSSEEESSDSSSDSESQDTKDPKTIANGTIDSHKTEHRKKKNKKVDKQKAKKVRRADSSAATSGKQTSDDNIHPEGEGESVDSRTSHSDSLTYKPAPSSENAITSDSSRDTESKTDNQLPTPVTQVLDALEASIAKHLIEHPTTPANTLLANNETHIQRLEQVLLEWACEPRVSRAAHTRAAHALGVTRAHLAQRDKCNAHSASMHILTEAPTETVPPAAVSAPVSKNKRKLVEEDNLDVSLLSEDQRQNMMLETIKRLMDLIEEFKPSMFANYNLECERVREEKKKLTSDGATVEKRLPKRRFPWCHRSRSLLYRITKLAGSQQAGAMLLAEKILPLFPKGFVRMPTLMRQANIGKDIKVPEIKRQRLGSSNHIPLNLHSQTIPPSNIPPTNIPPTVQTPPLFVEPIQFPSSLTVTATNVKTSPENTEAQNKDINLGQIMNSYAISKDLIVEREKSDKKEEAYIPPNNIGSITITPVPSQSSRKDKKTEKAPHKTDKSTSQSVQKTNIPDRQPSSVAKTSVTDNRQSSSVSKTSVTDNRQSSSVPKTSVPDNRQSSSVPKTSVPDNRQSSSVLKNSVPDNRQSSSVPKTSVPDNRQSSSVPKTSVPDNWQQILLQKPSVSDNRQHSSGNKSTASDIRHTSSSQKTSPTDNRQPSSHKTSVSDSRLPVTKPTTDTKSNMIRVKSPAVLNDLFKKDTTKKPDKVFSNPEKSHPNPKDRRLDTPLQIETNFHTTRKEPSPKNKDSSPRSKDSVSQKQIESLRVKENNIPRPALVPVHLSPTFAKPDKRPEKKKEVEKKKEIMIVSDLDPLSEPLSDDDPVAIDDSSSDVEVIENDRIESVVPLKDNKVPKNDEVDDIDRLMRNIREMEHSQEPTKLNSNTFSGVIDNSIAKHRIPHQGNVRNNIGNRNDKFAERTTLKKTDGCNGVTD